MMVEEDENTFCCTCFCDLPARRFALSRRTESISTKHLDGKTVEVVDVASDEFLLQFCSLACWKSEEPEMIEVYGFKEVYPAFAWTASCSKCGKPINRTMPYVSFVRLGVEIEEKPWLSVGKAFDDVEFAVLCSDCMPPTLRDDAVEMVEAEDVTPVHAVARETEAGH